MYSVEFRLNLSDVGNENLNISKTALIPTGLLGGLPLHKCKHGDRFTLYGTRAAYVKRLVQDGQLPPIELYTPSVEESNDVELYLYQGFDDDDLAPAQSLYPLYSDFTFGGLDGQLTENFTYDWDFSIGLHDDKIYRLYTQELHGRSYLKFDYYDLVEETVNPLSIVDGFNYSCFDMVYIDTEETDYFVVATSSGLKSLTLDGTFSDFASNYVRGITYGNDTFYGLDSNGEDIYLFGPDGEVDSTIELSNSDYRIRAGFGLDFTESGDLRAILRIQEIIAQDENEENVYSAPENFICSVDLITGEFSPVQAVGTAKSFAYLKNETNDVIVQTDDYHYPAQSSTNTILQPLKEGSLYLFSIDEEEVVIDMLIEHKDIITSSFITEGDSDNEGFFPIEPTLDNLVAEFCDDFIGEDPDSTVWEEAEIEEINYVEEEFRYEIKVANSEELLAADFFRIRYSNTPDYWLYLDED